MTGGANRGLSFFYNWRVRVQIPIFRGMKTVYTIILTALLLTTSLAVKAQMEYPFYAADDVFDWEMIRKDSLGVYLAIPNIEDKIVYINREKKLYRLLDRTNNVLEEGTYKLTQEKKNARHGLWKVYHEGPGQKLRSKGYYEDGKFVGVWENYYPSGKIKAMVSYTLTEVKGKKYYDQAGTYREYFESGNVKLEGFYKMSLDTNMKDAIYVVDPKTKKGTVLESKGEIPHARPSGTWYYYKENGELLATEDKE